MLTTEQIEAYRRDGYLVIPRLIQGEQLAHLRALTDQIVAEASTGIFARTLDLARRQLVGLDLIVMGILDRIFQSSDRW